MNRAEFFIPCPHEKHGDYAGRHPDHHPLTRELITGLLDTIKVNRAIATAEAQRTTAAAYVRIIQGIPGMTCPRPASGKVSRLESKLIGFIKTDAHKGATTERVNGVAGLLGVP